MSQRDRVVELIIERGSKLWGKDPSELSENTRFTEDVNAKSVHISQITTFLEDELDIEVPYMKFRRNKTIGEAADFVCEFLDEEDDVPAAAPKAEPVKEEKNLHRQVLTTQMITLWKLTLQETVLNRNQV